MICKHTSIFISICYYTSKLYSYSSKQKHRTDSLHYFELNTLKESYKKHKSKHDLVPPSVYPRK